MNICDRYRRVADSITNNSHDFFLYSYEHGGWYSVGRCGLSCSARSQREVTHVYIIRGEDVCHSL